uniref:DUF19 domain-containing protein n=1 Tax=Rhabditophanes sp. KR3021 TaxID=114890 RepID=A0AC35U019_9BILA
MRVLFLVGFVGCLVRGDQDYCPHHVNDQIQGCVTPVAQYAKILNQQNGNTNGFDQALSIPKVGGEVFSELCRLIRTFEDCVFEFKSRCPKHITINLIDASYGFLCNEGFNVFMGSAECLMELDLKPEVKTCHDETLNDIENVNTQPDISLPLKLERMCGALNFFSTCVRQPIRQSCGVEAWKVIHRVLKDTTKTLMPACQFNGNGSKHNIHKDAHHHTSHQRHQTEHSIELNTTKVEGHPKLITLSETEEAPYHQTINLSQPSDVKEIAVEDENIERFLNNQPPPLDNNADEELNKQKYQNHFNKFRSPEAIVVINNASSLNINNFILNLLIVNLFAFLF